jgi:hypothetical protein
MKQLKRMLTRALAALFIMFIFWLAAISEGLGYSAKVKVSSVCNPVEGHYCSGAIVDGQCNVSLNPFLFFISHIRGDGTVQYNFKMGFGPYVIYSPEKIKEKVGSMIAIQESFWNLPFLFLMGLSIVYLVEELFKVVENLVKEKPLKNGNFRSI